MNYLIKFFFMMMMSFMLMNGASAQTSTVADIKSEVISNLQKDGYLSDKMASEAATKYITPQDVASKIQIIGSDGVNVKTAEVSWTQYLSWLNFFKVVGVCLGLIALYAMSPILLPIITLVPAIVYQAVFLSFTVFGTIFPEQIWASQAFYVALFCSIGNLIILSWIVATYPAIQMAMLKLFNIGLPPSTIASFWLMIYFGVLAVVYQSSLFGFFAAVALSGVFTFTLIYTPGTLFLYFKENALAGLVFGHIAVLAVYVAVYHLGLAQPYIQYFNAGIQYYCSIALGVGLLVGASPFYKQSQAPFYALLFLIIVALSTVLYFFMGLTVIATTMFIFFALVFMEWIGYIGFKGGLAIGCAATGAMLYGMALILESHGAFILNNLKSVLG